MAPRAGPRWSSPRPHRDAESNLAAPGDPGISAVVRLANGGVQAVDGRWRWQASGDPAQVATAAGNPADVALSTERRDAMVAGFVPGIALGWSWPDMLRHALALADSVTADGEADLTAYEKLLPDVRVTGPLR